MKGDELQLPLTASFFALERISIGRQLPKRLQTIF